MASSEGSQGAVVCVFCGALPGNTPAHLAAARALAHEFHKRQISMVYGGGTVGLMGELAKTLVSLSGPSAVHGVIPKALLRYEAKPEASSGGESSETINKKVFGRTTVVQDMHERKALMAKQVSAGGEGSGFVALSGGYGTLEELMEITTWNQLGIHKLPVIVFNVEGFWNGLLQWMRTAVEQGFIKKENEKIVVEAKSAEEVITALKDYTPSDGRLELQWTEK